MLLAPAEGVHAAEFLVANRYALSRRIGSGGMGSVWMAYDQALDRVCAVKILDPDKAGNVEARKRFLREAKVTAQIRSVHVVEVFESGVWDGLPFIVMEALEGEDLGARLERRKRLSPAETHRIFAHVARALGRAHALGIVHRDIKPENVFLVQVDDEEVAKLLDFGIAHHEVYSPRDKATQAGTVLGTPCYMSPEQALGKPTDFRSDLWALGVLAFECLTGTLPFFHVGLGGLLAQILHEPIPSIVATEPTLPPAVEAWWRRAAAREPGERFRNVSEMSDALAVALGVPNRLHVPELVPGSKAVDLEPLDDACDSAVEYAARMGSNPPMVADTRAIVSTFRRKVRRRSALQWAFVVATITVLGGVSVFLPGRFGAPAAARPELRAFLPAQLPYAEPRFEPLLSVSGPLVPAESTGEDGDSTDSMTPDDATEAAPTRPRRRPRPKRVPSDKAPLRDYGI